MRTIRAVIRHYQAIHLAIGILGNVTFLAGSLLFLHQAQPWASYLFIAGSVGMLLGNLGSALVQLERTGRAATR